MNIAVLNYGEPWLVLASTSLIRGLLNKFPNSKIHFFVTQDSFPVVQYNQKIQAISGYAYDVSNSFDFAINMTPTIEASDFMTEIEAKTKLGFLEKNGDVFSVNKDADEYLAIMHEGQSTDRHLLQVLYRLVGLTWKGEGYDLAYYPKNRTNKSRTGIAISHDALRQFVKNNLKLQMSEIYNVPIRRNVLKKMDEINRCMNIITDDLFIMHASIALRKNVEFLDTKGLTTRIEFFSKGNYYRILDGDWQFQTQKNGTQESLQST